jgi:hypothetical protein
MQNWASSDLGATIVDVSSESTNCPGTSVLDWTASSVWLTDEGLPQWISLSLKNLNSDIVIRTVGWNCWQSYSTNPRKVTIHVSSDGSKFKLWDSFSVHVQRKGDFMFCIAPISTAIYPYIAFEVNRTFGGLQTYMNRVLLFSEELSMSPVMMRNGDADAAGTADDNRAVEYIDSDGIEVGGSTRSLLSPFDQQAALRTPLPRHEKHPALQQDTVSLNTLSSSEVGSSADELKLAQSASSDSKATVSSPIEFNPVIVKDSHLLGGLTLKSVCHGSISAAEYESHKCVDPYSITGQDLRARLQQQQKEHKGSRKGYQTSVLSKVNASSSLSSSGSRLSGGIPVISRKSFDSRDVKLTKAIDNVQAFIKRVLINTEGKGFNASPSGLKVVPDLQSPMHPRPMEIVGGKARRDDLSRRHGSESMTRILYVDESLR